MSANNKIFREVCCINHSFPLMFIASWLLWLIQHGYLLEICCLLFHEKVPKNSFCCSCMFCCRQSNDPSCRRNDTASVYQLITMTDSIKHHIVHKSYVGPTLFNCRTSHQFGASLYLYEKLGFPLLVIFKIRTQILTCYTMFLQI